jgi:hypothetical protein
VVIADIKHNVVFDHQKNDQLSGGRTQALCSQARLLLLVGSFAFIKSSKSGGHGRISFCELLDSHLIGLFIGEFKIPIRTQ